MKIQVWSLSLLFAVVACAQPATLEVKDAWARDTVGNVGNAAVYMTITSPRADRLIAASTPVAKKTDLMTMDGSGSTMGMKYLKAIDIPTGKQVSLNSGGLHIWLADLNQPLNAGQSFPLKLQFENAGEREVVVTVVKPGETLSME